MRRIVLILTMLILAGCDSGEVSLSSAIEAARDANFDMAISQYQALLRKEPENAMYHNNFGWNLFRKGQFKEATEQLLKARKLDSKGELTRNS